MTQDLSIALRKMSQPIVAVMTLLLFLFTSSKQSFSIERGGPYCGIYAVYGAACSLGAECRFEDIVHEDFVTSHRGSSAADLAKCAKRLGLNSQLFTSLGADSLSSAKEPLILHVARYGSLHRYNHWLLFLGMADHETCLIADENGRVAHVGLADLFTQWDGSALLIFRGSAPISTFDQPELAGFAYCSLLILGVIGVSIWSRSFNTMNHFKTAFQICVFSLLFGLPFLVDAITPTGVLRNPHPEQSFGHQVTSKATSGYSRTPWPAALIGFCYLISFTIAATLLYSSYFHLKNPYAFLVSITRYGLLNSTFASWLAIALPWWQLTLAFALILRHWPRVTTFLTAILLSAFTFAQVSAVARGLEIGCGCFGVVGEEKITAFTASRIGVLCALAWLVCGIEVWRYSRRPLELVGAPK